MNNTLKVLSLALSVALPLGTAVADTLDTDTASGTYAEQARTRAGEFQGNRDVEPGTYAEQARTRAGEFQSAREAGETRGYDVQAREQSREQVRTRVSEQRVSREQAGETFAGTAAREGWSSMQRPAGVERPSSLQRPSAASRPSMPMQRPRMR